MNEFLNRIFLDNTFRDYLVSAAIIAIVLILKTVLSKLVADLISKMVVDKKRQLNGEHFRALVISPIRLFVTVLTVLIAVSRLNFPEVLNFPVYRIKFQSIIEALARGVLIGSFIWLCIRMMEFIAGLLHERALLTNDRTDDQLIVFFRDFLKVIIWIIGVLLILKFSFGFPLSNVFTGLSLVGAAVALAFRESLENLIASFIIFFDKPFTIGDIVKVQSVNGTVEKIGLRSTRIRTAEKTYVTMPNKQMVDSILDNQSLRTQRNVLVKLELDKQTTSTQLEELITAIEELFKANDETIFDSGIFLSNTGHAAHVVQVEYFVTIDLPLKDFNKLQESVNLSIIKLMEEKEIRLAQIFSVS